MDSDEDDRTVIRPPGARTTSTTPGAAFERTAAATTPHATGGFAPTTGSPATTPPVAAPAGGEQHALTLPAGTRLAEFEITKTIGEGGFGIVYLASDHSLQRNVALKEYMPSSIASRVGATEIRPRSERHQETFDAGLKSFINEARLLAQFDHPSLLKVHRFWEANGTAYMVMPFLQGTTLRDTVRALPEPPGEAWIIGFLAPLLDALAMLHAAQCFHRDIAPDNILLLADSGRPLLLDFGAARRVIGETTQALTAILKPGYAPVEQYAEIPGLKQGAWTDIYALAAVVHWTITGKTPTASVGRLFNDTHVPLAERVAGRYSAAFLEAIDRALVVMPDKRTQTVEAFRDEIMAGGTSGILAPGTWPSPGATPVALDSRSRQHPTTPGSRPGVTEPPPLTAAATVRLPPVGATDSAVPAPRRRLGWIAAAVVLAAIAAGVAFFLRPSPPTSDASRETAVAPASTNSTTNAREGSATTSPSPSPAAAASAVVLPLAPPPAPQATETAAPAPSPGETGGESATAVPVAPAAEKTPEPARASRPRTDEKREVRAAEPVERTAKKAARTESRDEPVPAATPAKPANDNQAECARLFQRLSLGDTDPSIAERVRTLRCR